MTQTNSAMPNTGYTPAGQTQAPTTDNTPYVVVEPKGGLQAVQVGLLVELGLHPKQPKFAKTSSGEREKDSEGRDKIIFPSEKNPNNNKIAVYLDLLNQTYDYGGEIGEQTIREPLHGAFYGVSEGINADTIAPRDASGNYIKGRKWCLPPSSKWAELADATTMEDGSTVHSVIFNGDYNNNRANDISLLLGKPFLINTQVKKSKSGDKTYVNVRFKNPVPLMEGMPVKQATSFPLMIRMDDTDLLTPYEVLRGQRKIDFVRISDARKIVLALNYQGSKMQEAIRQSGKFDEAALIEDAKSKAESILAMDKELAEVLAEIARRNGGEVPQQAQQQTPQPAPQKIEQPKQAPVQEPTPDFDAFDDSLPF